MGQEENKNENACKVEKNNIIGDNTDTTDKSVKNKMEAMQIRINELKEKVKHEGELLHNVSSLADLEPSLDESLSDFKNNFESKLVTDESSSEKSLYYSASNYSISSYSSSADSTYNNFTNFVKSFVHNQDQKERLSLLQLHSEKQISFNMMRHSLSDLEARCSEELDLIERSLQHLNRLAVEFNVSTSNHNQDRELTAFDFYNNESENKLQIVWPKKNV